MEGWLEGREVGNLVGTGLIDGFDVSFVGLEEGWHDGCRVGLFDG